MKETPAEAACAVPGDGQLNMSGNSLVAPPVNYASGGGAQTMTGHFGVRGAQHTPARPAVAVTPAGPRVWFPSWTYQRSPHPQVPGFAIKDASGPPSAVYFPSAPVYTASRPPPRPQPPQQPLYSHPSPYYNYGTYPNPSGPQYIAIQPPPHTVISPPGPYPAPLLYPQQPPPPFTYPPPPFPAQNYFHSNYNNQFHSQNQHNIMSSPPTSPISPTDVAPAIHWQQELEKECERLQLARPVYSLHSDRRGGRTAWSCKVLVNGESYSARYWYAGHHNAHEDAAEVALKRLQQSSPTGTAASPHRQYLPPSSPPGSTSYVLSTSSGPSSSVAGHPAVRHHPVPPTFGHHQMQHYAAAGGRGVGGGAFNLNIRF